MSKIARCDLGHQMGPSVHWPNWLFVTMYWKHKTNQAGRSKPVWFRVEAELNGTQTSERVTAEPRAYVLAGPQGSSKALRRTQSRWTLPSEELCHPAARKLCQIRALHQEIPVGSWLMPGALAALFPAELLCCHTWICLHLKSALLWEDFFKEQEGKKGFHSRYLSTA